ncbi:c-type cytochrome [Novosphingobium flavum]|uniref:C-type cytochrome n=1 Tax=Novosphingobium flavum TaxID=1778672 RepID=A0A7X1FR71_9SPHN|nr:c-type cytochrome [Novosphingobium flavum]MBC2665466.1 c-type cytochrome [Novosphingobium flavum]
MIRSRRLAIATAIAGSLAVAWSLGWIVRQMVPVGDTGRLAYRPVEDLPPPVDMARLQQQWPSGLDGPADRNRLTAFQEDNAHAAPLPVRRAAPVPAGPVDLGALLAGADLAAGKSRAQVCASCHDFAKGGPDRIGPNLWGVVGRSVASRPGFSYSAAMAAQQGAWSYERLFAYLASPARMVPGTKMAFAGISGAQDRAAVIRYLATMGDSPPPLPQPLPAAGAGKVASN